LQRTAEQAAALGIPLSVLDDHPKVLTRVLPFLSNLTSVDDMRSIIKTPYKEQETQKARSLSGLSQCAGFRARKQIELIKHR
jgi:P2-related tail formation protein